MSYLPGKKNVLADYGTRHIPISDWDPPSEDPLELNPFLDCSVTLAVVQFPKISKHYYSSTDFDEMNKFNLQPIENDSSYSVILNGEQRICSGQLIFLYIMVKFIQQKFSENKHYTGL